jgi:hypothetical protein
LGTARPAGCKKRGLGRGAARAEVARSTAAAAEHASKRLKTVVPLAREASRNRAAAKHVAPAPVTRRHQKMRARLETLRARLAAMDATDPAAVKPADRKKTRNARTRTRRSLVKQRLAMTKAGCWLVVDQEAYQSHMAAGERRRTANRRRRGTG